MMDRVLRGMQEHPLVEPIFEEARTRGETVYLVGGAIRDLALGLVPKDLDFATEHPFELATRFAERYGSRVVSLGKEAFSTYRIPLEGFCLDWVGLAGGAIEPDLLRRDFTMNAIAYDSESGAFLDPTGGFGDLAEGRLKMAGSSAFFDDPVRIVKAYRLMAQFPTFKLDPETEAAIAAQRDMLVDVPPDRLHVELERLMQSPSAGAAMRKMAQSGVLFVLMPEMQPLKGLAQNDYHHADVLDHTLEALERFDGGLEWLRDLGVPAPSVHDLVVLRLACLMHDTGKADTSSVDEKGRIHFYGHSKPSSEKALEALKRLRFSNAVAEAAASLSLNHLRPLALLKTVPRQTAMRRLVHSMGDLLPLLMALAYADKSAARGRDCEKNLSELKALSQEVMALSASDGDHLRRLPKLVDGLQAVEILGLQRPGPELGLALDALLEKQVDGTITEPSQAVAFLKGWAARHPATAKR